MSHAEDPDIAKARALLEPTGLELVRFERLQGGDWRLHVKRVKRFDDAKEPPQWGTGPRRGKTR